MASPSQKAGSTAEEHACQFLLKQGLTLLARNWRNRYGEIDLIMLDNDDVVFVEVRSRQHAGFGSAIESIHYKKRATLIRTSQHFLHQKNWSEHRNARYDVVGVSHGQLDWIKNAFDSDNL